MTTVVANVYSIAGADEGTVFTFFSSIRESGEVPNRIITDAPITASADSSGDLSVVLDPGLAAVTFRGHTFSFTVPTSGTVQLWPLIEAGVDLPATTPAQLIVQVVENYLEENPPSGSGGSVAWADVTGKPTTFAPIIGSGATQAVAGSDGRLTDQRTPADGSVTNAKVAADAAIAQSKISGLTAALALTVKYVLVTTGSETRPAGDFVLWYGGEDSPTNMGDNDLWIPASTEPEPDTEAPSVPTGLSAASVTSNSLTLNWTASTDNVGVTQYQVRQNGSVIASPTTNSHAVSGLSAATEYTFAVRARDAAGNWSAWSADHVVTTDEAPVAEGFSVWGDTTPATPAYSTENPSIHVGNVFYVYADGTNAARSLGARLRVPDGAAEGKPVTFKMYLHNADATPNLATDTPVATANITAVVEGWNEVEWPTPVNLTIGQFILITYEFTGTGTGAYLFVTDTSMPEGSSFDSSPDADVAFSEESPTGLTGRSWYRIGTGATQVGEASWYGLDILVDADA